MPLLVKDYTWRQTKNVVVIRVPLKGVHHSRVDIFSSNIYIKVRFKGLLCKTSTTSVLCTELFISDVSYFFTGTFSSISIRNFPLLFGKRT